jgi:integrase
VIKSRGEILNLRWLKVDLEMGIIMVTDTKSGEDREITICPVLRPEFERLRPSNDSTGFVFPNPKTGKPYTEVKGSFKKALKSAGISNFRFHDRRHTLATRLAEMGASMSIIQRMLGHSSGRMTERYVNPGLDQMRAATDLLASRASKVAPTSENLSHCCPATKASSTVPEYLTHIESVN